MVHEWKFRGFIGHVPQENVWPPGDYWEENEDASSRSLSPLCEATRKPQLENPPAPRVTAMGSDE